MLFFFNIIKNRHEHVGFEALECAGTAASKSENMKFSCGANTGFFKSTVALKPTTAVHATGDQARQNVTDGIPNMHGMPYNIIGVEQQAKETEVGGMQAVQTDAQNNSSGNLDPNTRAAHLGATDVNKEMLAHVEKLSKVDGVTKIIAGGDWIEVMRSPSRKDEEEIGINSSIVNGTMVQQQIVPCTSGEKIVQGNELMCVLNEAGKEIIHLQYAGSYHEINQGNTSSWAVAYQNEYQDHIKGNQYGYACKIWAVVNSNSSSKMQQHPKSFSLEKWSGKKCYMLAARSLKIVWADTPRYWRWISLPESRTYGFGNQPAESSVGITGHERETHSLFGPSGRSETQVPSSPETLRNIHPPHGSYIETRSGYTL
ncbi:f-box protein pp2-b1 [Nicotiana attenuata]|uniref:F-box protein pp2-b1 n=1 Tax=Nicotiana attenuata TaxID=49451 RepID=A0A314L504_NICAT|nr:f-box protein pp2-b1 [Nicotiana attenuata]